MSQMAEIAADSDEEEQRYQAEVMAEQYQADQDALPVHKRDGYAERMAELADIRRKEQRENFA